MYQTLFPRMIKKLSRPLIISKCSKLFFLLSLGVKYLSLVLSISIVFLIVYRWTKEGLSENDGVKPRAQTHLLKPMGSVSCKILVVTIS